VNVSKRWRYAVDASLTLSAGKESEGGNGGGGRRRGGDTFFLAPAARTKRPPSFFTAKVQTPFTPAQEPRGRGRGGMLTAARQGQSKGGLLARRSLEGDPSSPLSEVPKPQLSSTIDMKA